MKLSSAVHAIFLSSATAFATDVQKIVRDSFDDFAKGDAKGVSITERG